MAIDHDVDRIADGVAHRLDAVFRVAEGRGSIQRHGGRDGHGFERAKSLGDAASRQIGEARGVGGIAAIEIFHLPAAQVRVEADEIAHGSAPEPVTRDAVDFAENVPQGDVDAADGGAADDAVAVPEVLAVHHLPEVLDAGGVLVDEKFADVFDRADDGAGVPFERRLTPSPQARLIGGDFDENPVAHPGVADEGLDVGNFHANLT